MKYLPILLFLSFLQTSFSQNAVNQRCVYSWEMQTSPTVVYDFQLYDTNYKPLFDWSSQIGHTQIIALDKKHHQIKGFQNYCTYDDKDSVIYTSQQIYNLVVDTSICKIATQNDLINDLTSKKARVLAKEYKKIKKYLNNNKQLSDKCNNLNYLMMYMHDLEIATLKGNKKCDELFFAFEKDFGEIIGASGVEEYRGNVLLVYNLRYKEQLHLVKKYHINNLFMQILLTKDGYFVKNSEK